MELLYAKIFLCVQALACWITPMTSATQVRLLGSHSYEGTVEIYHNGAWGTICDDNFDNNEALVICRMLGFHGDATAFCCARYGQGSGYVLLDELQCTGRESDIASCHNPGWKVEDCSHGEDAGVRCVTTYGRLIGGRGNFEGRVDLNVNGQWGSICDVGFDDRDARVMCRMMGFHGGKAVTSGYFGQSSGSSHIWAENLRCYGNETDLADCRRRYTDWDHAPSSNCSHSNDAGVICDHTSVRLVGGAVPSEGRFEVQHNGVWGSVCSSGFTRRDADVLCRMLGFNTSAISIQPNAHYGEGGGPVWLSNIGCHGDEVDIGFCNISRWDATFCNHRNDVGIKCQPTDVRLVLGAGPWEGSVEILLNGSWGGICDTNFGQTEATIICRMLGYTGRDATHEIYYHNYFYYTTPTIYLDNLSCHGDESDISQCAATFHSSCNPSDHVGLKCQGAHVRLVGGAHSNEGRVELLHNGQWGTICDSGWDDRDAAVICRSLVPTFPLDSEVSGHAVEGHNFGYGDGPVWMSSVLCNGTESDVMTCPADVTGGVNCDHSHDAGVSCDFGQELRLTGGSANEGILEVYDHGAWQSFCSTGWHTSDARVVCRQLGFWTAVPTIHPNSSLGHSNGTPYDIRPMCTGNEGSLLMCTMEYKWRANTCTRTHTLDLGLTCTQTNLGSMDIRLVDGPGPWKGRLEVKVGDNWQGSCHSFWDTNMDAIVCKTLNYQHANATSYPTDKGYSSTMLRSLTCVGNETNLGQCRVRPYTSSCTRPGELAVGMDCSDGITATLGNPPHVLSGEVQFHLPNASETYSVCSSGVNTVAARVICSMAGYRHTSPNLTATTSQWGYERLYSTIQCSGWEDHVGQCSTSRRNYSCTAAVIQCFKCQHTYTTTHGSISSPYFPSYYPANTDCLYVITPPGNQRLKLQFQKLDLAGGGDYIEVRDGAHGRQLGNFTTNSAVPILVTDRDLYIRFKTHNHTGASGFNLTWSPLELEDALTMGCGSHGWDIAVNTTILRRIYPDTGVSQIKLNDQRCTGKVMGDLVLFQQSYTACSTQSKTNGNSVVYTNELLYPESTTPFPIIVRNYRWKVEVECDVARTEIIQTNFHPNQTIAHQTHTHHVTGTTHYSISTRFYTDSTFYKEIRGNPLTLKTGKHFCDNVFVKVAMDTDDVHVKMRLDTCYTKPDPGAGHDLTYALIDDGCSVDQSTSIISQGTHETRFVFNAFEFPASHGSVYVYCNATFCKTSDLTNRCSQTCHGTPSLVGRGVAYGDDGTEMGVAYGSDGIEMGVSNEPEMGVDDGTEMGVANDKEMGVAYVDDGTEMGRG